MANSGARSRRRSPRVRGRLRIVAMLSVSTLFVAESAPMSVEARYNASVGFSIVATKLKGNNATTCVGDDVPIKVSVSRSLFLGGSEDVPGARIEAAMSGGSIGELKPISIYTGWDPKGPGAASFNFHALKAGTATITFTATIDQAWWGSQLGVAAPRHGVVRTNLSITVEKCSYDVEVVSNFTAQGVVLTGRMKGALKQDSDDPSDSGRFNGNGIVTWTPVTVGAGDCSSTITLEPSEATLIGRPGRGLDLVVDVEYLPATLVNTGGCPAGVLDTAQPAPSAVTVTVSVLGGVQRSAQTLDEAAHYAMSGSALVVVYAVRGK